MKSCLEVLLGDQRTSDIFEEKKPQMAKGCTQAISSCCSICDMMIISSTVHNGATCTKSECSEKYWKGGNQWNRLWRDQKSKRNH